MRNFRGKCPSPFHTDITKHCRDTHKNPEFENLDPPNNALAANKNDAFEFRNANKSCFEGFNSIISQVSRKNFMFLQKTIMYSYTWSLDGQMTTMRILLIEQLSLIIKNEGNDVFDEMLEGLWDILIRYLLEFKLFSDFYHIY